jgi:hypothetical protein
LPIKASANARSFDSEKLPLQKAVEVTKAIPTNIPSTSLQHPPQNTQISMIATKSEIQSPKENPTIPKKTR